MKSLSQLGRRHATDQETLHDYCRTMEQFVAPLRDSPVVIMEQGVLAGQGLRMWADYFTHPDARIIGIDPNTFDRAPIEDERVHVVIGSQTDASLIHGLVERFGPIDWCTDDASHFVSAQTKAFPIIWPFIKPGGFWCCQDLHTYAAPELCDGPENIMQYLTRIATELQGLGAQARGKVEPTDTWTSIDTMTFRKGLCVIRKA